MKVPNKILVSGGWGYSNLGDDAILVSTIRILEEKYPNAEIVIMTYDCEDTRKISYIKKYKIIPSIHRYLVGDYFYTQQKNAETKILVKNKRLGIFQKIKNKYNGYNSLIYNKKINKKFAKYIKRPEALQCFDEFLNVDLFVQAGGGYFLGSWYDSVYAHVLELVITKKLKIKSLIIGQSIGPFDSPHIKEIALIGLKAASFISVRDNDSLEELKSYGLQPVLIPDTVLSESNFNYSKEQRLGVILGSNVLDENQLEIISSAIIKSIKNNNYAVSIIITRLWKVDKINAQNLYNILKQADLDVVLIFPENYQDLQDVLGVCKIIISQNLHGLIMGWRAGAVCISLDTRRKFVSFMTQSNQSDKIIDIKNVNYIDLLELLSSSEKEVNKNSEIRRDLANEVKGSFNISLDKVLDRRRLN